MKADLVAPDAKRARVLMVLPWDLGSMGGVNAVVANLYERLAFHGRWQPLILAQSWADREPNFVCEDGHEKIAMRVRGPLAGNSLPSSLLKYAVALPRELGKVARIVRTFRVAVVNAHYPTLGMVNVALARRMGLAKPRLILSLHGTDIRMATCGNGMQRAMWRWLLQEADAVVAVSEDLAQFAADFEPRIRPRLQVVHNGIDADRFVASSEGPGAGLPDLEGRRIVLSVGAFDWNKGHDVLLRAFSELAKRHADLHLVLIGQTSPQHSADVKGMVDSLGLGARCTLVRDAPRDLVARWLSVATTFVLASRTEGFGIVLLEAGAFGVPVVATRVGGIPDVISGPEYGVLVPPDDPTALGAAIDGVLNDPAAARRMGERLRERVQQVFSWEEAYRKYECLFAGLPLEAACT